jgi:hypothetical protein
MLNFERDFEILLNSIVYFKFNFKSIVLSFVSVFLYKDLLGVYVFLPCLLSTLRFVSFILPQIISAQYFRKI